MMFFPTMTRRKTLLSSSPLLLALLVLVVVTIMDNKLKHVDGFLAPSRLKQQHSSTSTVSISKTRQGTLSSPTFVLQSSATSAASSSTMEEDGGVAAASAMNGNNKQQLSKNQSALVRLGMISFIVSMCIALPVTLLPQKLLYKLGFVDRKCKERWALSTAQWCARTLLCVFPFCKIKAYSYHNPNPPASIWTANHASMLDVFVMLAADKKLRGPMRRPIKIIYWKQLEDNPISKLLFQQAGFIPVQMAANKPGEANDYDKSSFKQLVRSARQCFQDGFDLGILPEGQLNPTPENGLQHVFPGAFTLAKMGGQRPIQMMALHGMHQLWHPEKGMQCTSRDVAIKVYPAAIQFDSAPDFVACFNAVVGHFATYGKDLPPAELRLWLSGKSQTENNKEEVKEEPKQEEEAVPVSDKAAVPVSQQEPKEELIPASDNKATVPVPQQAEMVE